MKHMIGLNPILAGALRVAGMEWSTKTRDALFHKIGVMYQSGALFGSMTCLENVMLPLEEFTRLKRAARRDRAMELLAEFEKSPRGIYGGAAGYFSFTGDMDFAIVIRTMILDGTRLTMRAGAGIVADSDPVKEYNETVNKSKAVFEAAKFAETL